MRKKQFIDSDKANLIDKQDRRQGLVTRYNKELSMYTMSYNFSVHTECMPNCLAYKSLE